MKVDYIIAGGGLCGALLSWHLIMAGRSVVVIDDVGSNAASRVAGGIINPVTGMRLVRSWLIDQLMPFARNTYRQLEKELHLPLVRECSILDFYASRDQEEAFENKAATETEYLGVGVDESEWTSFFRFNYGVGQIAPCLLVDLAAVVNGLGDRLRTTGCLVEERFDWRDCIVGADKVTYRNLEANAVICCEGADGCDNPYFALLPWSKDKGEAIIAAIPGLPRHHIYKQQFSIVPWGNEDLFWIGATHDWKYTDLQPSAGFRAMVKEHLDYFLKIPYAITSHLVARRPANLDRKPFVGMHPKYRRVGILNGMGGKGASMAPYFASQLACHLVHGTPMPDADVQRFGKILAR